LIDEFTKIIEINPKNATAYYNRGLTKFHLDDYIGAVSDFSIAIQLDHKFTSAYFNRGVVKLMLEEKNSCIVGFTQS